MDPYQVLIDIERNSKTYANRSPQQAFLTRDWKGLGFQASDLNFVCPLSEVLEVLPLPKLSSLASSKPWFLGLCNLRGHLLPVNDLEGFVSALNPKRDKESRIIVTEHEGKNFGFFVNHIFGIERFFSKDIKPLNALDFKSSEVENYLPYISGYFRETKTWYILNFSSIIKTSDFYHITS